MVLQGGSFELGGKTVALAVQCSLNYAHKQIFTHPSQKTGAGRENENCGEK